MDTHFVSGIPRNYVELIAETLGECADLVSIANSAFAPPDTFWLYTESFVGGKRTVGLRIYVGEAKSELAQGLDPETKSALTDAANAARQEGLLKK